MNTNMADLFREYADSIFRFAYIKLGNREESEDVVAEVFSRSLSSNKLDNVENQKAWLYGIARNVVYEQYRYRIHQDSNIPNNTDIETIPTEVLTPEETILNEIEQENLRNSILSLDDKSKEVIMLRIWDDFSFAEIATELEEKESTVKLRFYRGIEKVKKSLELKQTKLHSNTLPVILGGILFLKYAKAFSLSASAKSAIVANIFATTSKVASTGGIFAIPAVKGIAIALGVACAGAVGLFGYNLILEDSTNEDEKQAIIEIDEEEVEETIEVDIETEEEEVVVEVAVDEYIPLGMTGDCFLGFDKATEDLCRIVNMETGEVIIEENVVYKKDDQSNFILGFGISVGGEYILGPQENGQQIVFFPFGIDTIRGVNVYSFDIDTKIFRDVEEIRIDTAMLVAPNTIQPAQFSGIDQLHFIQKWTIPECLDIRKDVYYTPECIIDYDSRSEEWKVEFARNMEYIKPKVFEYLKKLNKYEYQFYSINSMTFSSAETITLNRANLAECRDPENQLAYTANCFIGVEGLDDNNSFELKLMLDIEYGRRQSAPLGWYSAN